MSDDGGGGSGETREEGEGGKCEAAVFSFYGADEKETGKREIEGDMESGADIGMNGIIHDEPGAVVELPCYAPEVCEVRLEERTTEECSENEVKQPEVVVEIEPVTVEISEEDAMETTVAPDENVTEADIFGSTDDESHQGEGGYCG